MTSDEAITLIKKSLPFEKDTGQWAFVKLLDQVSQKAQVFGYILALCDTSQIDEDNKNRLMQWYSEF